MGQLKGSDRALGFRWPTNHPPTGDMKRTTFAADTRTVTEKIFERCPFSLSITSPPEPHFYFFVQSLGHTRSNCAVFCAVGVKMSTKARGQVSKWTLTRH